MGFQDNFQHCSLHLTSLQVLQKQELRLEHSEIEMNYKNLILQNDLRFMLVIRLGHKLSDYGSILG